jgi:hypothetical protein
VDKEGRNTVVSKSEWITGTSFGSMLLAGINSGAKSLTAESWQPPGNSSLRPSRFDTASSHQR